MQCSDTGGRSDLQALSSTFWLSCEHHTWRMVVPEPQVTEHYKHGQRHTTITLLSGQALSTIR